MTNAPHHSGCRCILPSAVLPGPRIVCDGGGRPVRSNTGGLAFSLTSGFRSRMLPYSLGCAVTSALAGMVVSRTAQYRPMMQGSFAVFTLGMGLMIMLDDTSSVYATIRHDISLALTYDVSPCSAEKVLYPLVAALGLGCLFQVCILKPVTTYFAPNMCSGSPYWATSGYADQRHGY